MLKTENLVPNIIISVKIPSTFLWLLYGQNTQFRIDFENLIFGEFSFSAKECPKDQDFKQNQNIFSL